MLKELTSKQLSEWEAYNELEPIGEDRADYRTAMLAATMVNLWSKEKVEVKDFVPIWDSEERKRRNTQSIESMKKVMHAIARTTDAKLTTKADREE